MLAALSSLPRWGRAGHLIADLLPAVLVLGVGLFEIWVQTVLEPGFLGSRVVHVLALVTYSAALALRRHVPVSALLVAVVGFVVEWSQMRGTGQISAEAFLTSIVLFYSVGAHAQPRRGVFGGLAAAGVLLALDVADVAAGHEGSGEFVGFYLVAAGSWAAGYALRGRSLRALQLEEDTRELRRERDIQRSVAAADERARIARELHDIISHTVTLMVIQMGAARHVLRSDPDEAERQLLAGEAAGRDAVAELRRMLGLLKGAEHTLHGSPQPGGRDLRRLLDENRLAGLPVDLRLEGAPGELPSGIGLTAYRIVQEALTNVRKHAGATGAEVTLRYGDDELEIEVTDDGCGPVDGAPSPTGHGLIGMRERVALYGGDMAVEPAPGGGLRVRAQIPLRRSP